MKGVGLLIDDHLNRILAQNVVVGRLPSLSGIVAG